MTYDLEDASGSFIARLDWGAVVKLARALTLTDANSSLRVVAHDSDGCPRYFRLMEVVGGRR